MATDKHTPRLHNAAPVAAVREKQNLVIERALHILEARARIPGIFIDDTDTAANWFRLRLSESPREIFAVAWLDRRYRLIDFHELFFGTIDRSDVHMREVVRSALDCNASAALFAHNHPSGSARPSDDDILITTRLVSTLHYVRVKVLDHFIVTATAPPFSMAKEGYVMGGLMGRKQKKYWKLS